MSPINETLSGHTLLTLMPWTPPTSWIDRVQSQFPDLKIIPQLCPDFWGKDIPSDISEDDLKNATIVLTWRTFPPKEKSPKLQYIQLSSAGANHIMGHTLYESGEVTFCTASGVHPPQIAEWVICTFLAHQHEIPMYLEGQKRGDWMQPETDEDVEDSVGLRMGILGYGAIGRQCAKLATAMGMSIYAYNLRPRPTPESRRDETYVARLGLGDPEGVLPEKWFSGNPKTPDGAANLKEFLSSDLDILVVCTPLTTATQGMIAKEQLELLRKKKTFLSNVGRGPIVNTNDLIHALNNDWIRGAALDVTDPEPLPKDHELWKAKNVIITPHVSGNSNSYNERVLGILEYNLRRLAKGEGLTNAVERDVGY